MKQWTIDCYKNQYIHSVCSKREPSYQDVLEHIGKCEYFLKQYPHLSILLDIRRTKRFSFYKEYVHLAQAFGVRIAFIGRYKQMFFLKKKFFDVKNISFFNRSVTAFQWLEGIDSSKCMSYKKPDHKSLEFSSYLEMDLKGDIKYINHDMAGFLGYDQKELLGKEIVEIYADVFEAFNRVQSWLQTRKASVQVYWVEYRKKNGEICYGLTAENPLFNRFGKFIGFSLNIIDVSMLHHGRFDVDKIQNRLEVALEASQIGVWEFNISSNQLIWDEQMYRLYGVEEKTFSGAYNAWANGVHPDDLVMSENALKMAIEGKKKFDTQFRVCYPSGEVRHIRAIANVIKDKNGQPDLIIGANWDITNEVQQANLLKKSKEESDRANRAKSDFLSHMSHEIRTPMNGVLGVAALLKEDENMTLKQQKLLDTMLVSGQSMMIVLNDILDYSKMTANKLTLENHSFHFPNFIDSILDLFKPDAERKDLLLELELDEHIPVWIVSDSTRIRQVLSNLLSNAIKFTHQGFIKIAVKQIYNPNFSLRFTVSDSGIGIPDHKKKLIFDSFSQADDSTTREYGGTGLGLAISQKLVEILGGKLEVAGEVNQGSQFDFVIPVAKGHEVQEKDPNHIEKYHHMNVLVVEDNQVNQDIILGFLEKLGIDADIAHHGEHAIESVKYKKYDLIFMDCQMPIMDGYEASRYIRDHYGHDVVIIALTARAMEGEKEQCLSSGMNDYLTKPISKQRLQETLSYWFEK